MLTTAISTLGVVCQSCNKQKFVGFLPNRDKLTCDICGEIRPLVTYCPYDLLYLTQREDA